jgi:hypothetical protein
VNAHVIRHLDRNCRIASHTASASGSEWDIERRVRPSTSDHDTTWTIGPGGTFARFAQRAQRAQRTQLGQLRPARRSLIGSLRAVLSPGRTAGGVIGS